MSKKNRPKRQPALSESQMESPETMSDEELAARQAQIEDEMEERRQRRGHELLAEGARLLGQRRPGEAMKKLERAAELMPDNVEVQINIGGAYILQHRYNQAVPVLERASEMAPDNPMVWVNLAAAHLGRLETSGPKQQERAIDAYEHAIQADPETPNVHYNLGLIYKDRREWHRARAHFYRALEVNPDDADARHWLDKLATLEQESKQASEADPAEGANEEER